MNETVKTFLDKVTSDKREQLMGIALDRGYWLSVIGDDDESTLRQQLDNENAKRVIDKMGKVLKDERDMDAITKLSKRIDEIVEADKKLVELDIMERTMTNYLRKVLNPGDDVIAKLEAAAKAE